MYFVELWRLNVMTGTVMEGDFWGGIFMGKGGDVFQKKIVKFKMFEV